MSSVENQVSINHPTANNNCLPKTVLGVGLGGFSAYVLRAGSKTLQKAYRNNFIKEVDSFSEEQQDALYKEANRMIDESGIRAAGFKGITIVDLEQKTKQIVKPKKKKLKLKSLNKEYLKAFYQRYLKTLERYVRIRQNPKGKIPFVKAYKQMEAETLLSLLKGSLALKAGVALLVILRPIKKLSELFTGILSQKALSNSKLKNAFTFGAYNPLSNRIVSSKRASLLHEVGHAINRNGKFLTKLPVPIAILCLDVIIPVVTLNALFTRKSSKSDEDEQKTKIKKLRDFTHRHIGLTVTGLFIPTLIEEGLASSRAIRHANAAKNMSEVMRKQHNKNLKLAYGSYLIAAAITGLATKLAVSVKDKVAESGFNKK